jgi:hypothetical protein
VGKPCQEICLRPGGNTEAAMRAMFLIWIGLILAGIVFFTIVGFSHR